MIENFKFIERITAENFLLEMIKLGNPLEISLVGVFDEEGRGSRREMELPFHQDGDSPGFVFKNRIDYVGLYCIVGGEAETIIKINGSEEEHSFSLKEGQAIVFDNKNTVHARRGIVGNRLLLRAWVEKRLMGK